MALTSIGHLLNILPACTLQQTWLLFIRCPHVLTTPRHKYAIFKKCISFYYKTLSPFSPPMTPISKSFFILCSLLYIIFSTFFSLKINACPGSLALSPCCLPPFFSPLSSLTEHIFTLSCHPSHFSFTAFHSTLNYSYT